MNDDEGSANFINNLKKTTGLETFNAEGTGTRYATIAKAKGLALAVTAKVTNAGGLLMVLYIRVRVQRLEGFANMEDGPAMFGFPEMTSKSANHSSCEVAIPVLPAGYGKYEIGKAIDEGKLVQKVVDTIYDRLTKAKVAKPADKEAVCEYLISVFADKFPFEQGPKVPDEFYVPKVGDEAIGNHIKALLIQLFPSKMKPEVAE